MILDIAHFINLFTAGMLAGLEVGIHYGTGASMKVLRGNDQILFRQSLVLKLRVLIPVLFVLTALSAISVTLLDSHSQGYLCRCAGLLTLVLWIFTRAFGTIPVNSASLTWDAGAPPSDWRARIDRANLFHSFGMGAAVALFALFLTAAILMKRQS